MKLRTVMLVGTLLVLLGAARALAEEAGRRYVETHGDRRQVVVYGIVPSAGGFVVSSISATSTEVGRWVSGTGLVTWQQKRPAEGTDLSGARSGSVIRFTGTWRGKPVTRDVGIDGAPWYQIFGPGMADLLPAGADRQEFWVVNPDDLTPHKMLVRRWGRQSIDVNGQSVSAERIHFSPAGALAPFWGADFWYREADMAWVYSRLPEGGGVTVTTIESLSP